MFLKKCVLKEIFKNSFFHRTHRLAASIVYNLNFKKNSDLRILVFINWLINDKQY